MQDSICVLGVQLAFLKNSRGFVQLPRVCFHLVVVLLLLLVCYAVFTVVDGVVVFVFFICYFCFDLLSLSLPFVCAAAIVHNDGVPVGDDSIGPEGARGQAKPRDTPMMLATTAVAFSRVKSN